MRAIPRRKGACEPQKRAHPILGISFFNHDSPFVLQENADLVNVNQWSEPFCCSLGFCSGSRSHDPAWVSLFCHIDLALNRYPLSATNLEPQSNIDALFRQLKEIRVTEMTHYNDAQRSHKHTVNHDPSNRDSIVPM